MANGDRPYFKAIRDSLDAEELVKDPFAFTLLYVVAKRASRVGNRFVADGLEPGEALIGDYRSYGMTRGQYREATKRLEKWQFITTRTTNKGTVAKLINSDIWDINICKNNHQDSQTTTIEQPSNNHRTTTNKNVKNDKNVKKRKTLFSDDSKEMSLSLFLKQQIESNALNGRDITPTPNLQAWSDCFRLMLGKDGLTAEEIRIVIGWCTRDPFWKTNVLSATTLRKQYSKLLARMNENGNGNNSNSRWFGRSKEELDRDDKITVC